MRQSLFVVGAFTDTERMICDSRWKRIVYRKVNREQSFDLRHDPDELGDLIDKPEHRSVRNDLKARLERWCRDHGNPLFADKPRTATGK